jgi:DNA-binding LytR/AlgR family response regulator
MNTCIIIDDDSLAIANLKKLLHPYTSIIIANTFTKCKLALEYLEYNTVDIVFLDIKLKDGNGVDIANKIAHKCTIIFTTSFTRFALDGYNIGVVDYLLKPIQEERLKIAINKAIFTIKQKQETNVITKQSNNVLNLRADRKIYRVETSEIIFIESLREYICYYTKNNKILTLSNMQEVANALPKNFVRIHRSYFINLDYIKSYNTTHVILQNDKELTIGRIYKSSFKEALSTLTP